MSFSIIGSSSNPNFYSIDQIPLVKEALIERLGKIAGDPTCFIDQDRTTKIMEVLQFCKDIIQIAPTLTPNEAVLLQRYFCSLLGMQYQYDDYPMNTTKEILIEAESAIATQTMLIAHTFDGEQLQSLFVGYSERASRSKIDIAPITIVALLKEMIHKTDLNFFPLLQAARRLKISRDPVTKNDDIWSRALSFIIVGAIQQIPMLQPKNQLFVIREIKWISSYSSYWDQLQLLIVLVNSGIKTEEVSQLINFQTNEILAMLYSQFQSAENIIRTCDILSMMEQVENDDVVALINTIIEKILSATIEHLGQERTLIGRFPEIYQSALKIKMPQESLANLSTNFACTARHAIINYPLDSVNFGVIGNITFTKMTEGLQLDSLNTLLRSMSALRVMRPTFFPDFIKVQSKYQVAKWIEIYEMMISKPIEGENFTDDINNLFFELLEQEGVISFLPRRCAERITGILLKLNLHDEKRALLIKLAQHLSNKRSEGFLRRVEYISPSKKFQRLG